MKEPVRPDKIAARAIERRRFIQGSAAVLASTGITIGACSTAPRGRFRDDPFALGVASGEPLSDGIVLWTRLITDAKGADPAASMPNRAIPVRWQIARDSNMTRIVQEGDVRALPEDAHSVHVEVSGLEPAHTYFYRFYAGGLASETGRTRTAPAEGANIAQVRFATSCCQNYEAGYYTAYRHMSEEDLDFVIHLGDYIYEGPDQSHKRPWNVRAHPDHTCVNLEQYRQRYALYKSDPDLRAAHAAFPFLPVFDDHEVNNNWAGNAKRKRRSRDAFLLRRQAAFKAYYEHLPLRRFSKPRGPWMQLYRRANFGSLLTLSLCDTRQYRTSQPCKGKIVSACAGRNDPAAQMLGPRQERWLMNGLITSEARWNVLAQQVLMAQLDRDRNPSIERYAMDKWDGYRVPRQRLLRLLGRYPNLNPVVLTGDIHRHMALELRTDFGRPDAPPVATELVASSITSRGDRRDMTKRYEDWMAQNPHLRFISDLRGYTRTEVTREQWRTDFRVVDTVAKHGGAIRTRASALIEPGRPGIHLSPRS